MMRRVSEFGKFRYNCLPMDMCASGDTFQNKLDKLLGDIEGVKTYIDDILLSSKYWFGNHIKQPRIIFSRMHASGLKVIVPKCSFGLKEINYLGCIITREGIKTKPRKVQGTMALGRPSNNNEA